MFYVWIVFAAVGITVLAKLVEPTMPRDKITGMIVAVIVLSTIALWLWRGLRHLIGGKRALHAFLLLADHSL
jgi:hypothetical protein